MDICHLLQKSEIDNDNCYDSSELDNDNYYELYRHLFNVNGNVIKAKKLNGKKNIFILFNEKYDIQKISNKIYKFKKLNY